jgi:hypothetical protein
MKKFTIFLLLVIAGYFAYDTFLKERQVVSIEADYFKNRESVDINAPSLQAKEFAHYEGTIKNISDEILNNIIVTYLIDATPSTASIDNLKPGEEKNFSTNPIMLRNMDPSHYLKDITYDGK